MTVYDTYDVIFTCERVACKYSTSVDDGHICGGSGRLISSPPFRLGRSLG